MASDPPCHHRANFYVCVTVCVCARAPGERIVPQRCAQVARLERADAAAQAWRRAGAAGGRLVPRHKQRTGGPRGVREGTEYGRKCSRGGRTQLYSTGRFRVVAGRARRCQQPRPPPLAAPPSKYQWASAKSGAGRGAPARCASSVWKANRQCSGDATAGALPSAPSPVATALAPGADAMGPSAWPSLGVAGAPRRARWAPQRPGTCHRAGAWALGAPATGRALPRRTDAAPQPQRPASRLLARGLTEVQAIRRATRQKPRAEEPQLGGDQDLAPV